MLVSVSELVTRLSEELASASEDVESIELAVGSLQQASAEMALRSAIELQRLDLLRQKLSELARFLRTVKPASGEGQHVDVAQALADMLLADLRHRLQGRNKLADVDSLGDFELLD